MPPRPVPPFLSPSVYLLLVLTRGRTYRERKEDYIKSLEEEVVQLRANEANIANETRKLYSENAALRNLLLQHGIEPPPHVEISDTSQSLADPDDAVTVSIAKDRGKHPQIQVRPTVSHATTQDRVRSSSGAECGLSPELQGIGLMHQGECTSPETCLANRSSKSGLSSPQGARH